MNREELTLAVAAALVGAVLLGWLLHAVFSRIEAGAGPRDVRKTAEMASRLHAAEEARSAAETRLREVEETLTRRLSEVESDLAASVSELERAHARSDEIRDAYRDAMADRDRLNPER